MGYIVCEECGDYYELKPGEHPEDFSSCHCGGKLRYERGMIDKNYDTHSSGSGFKFSSLSKNFKILGGAAALIIVFLVKFSPKLIGLSLDLFDFSSSVPGNSTGTGFPFQYIIFALIIIAIIATRILRPLLR